MTNPTGSTATSAEATAIPLCPACGQPLGNQPVEQCPLCSFKFGDARATDADVTPYALAFQQDESRLLAMSRWVWTAGSQRLKHLAMMRSSPAARRFAVVHVVVLAFALAILRATLLGWRVVTFAEAATGRIERPTGRGWFHIAAAESDGGNEAVQAVAGLWWNPAQAILGGAVALVAGLLLLILARSLIRVGVEAAHAGPYRGEERMGAAQCYATAWATPIIVATVILWFRPLGTVFGGPATLANELAFLLPAGIFTCLAVIFGWFWLLRLAATVPAHTRGPVTMMLALGVPAILLAGAVAWWFGLERLYEPLFDALQMSF